MLMCVELWIMLFLFMDYCHSENLTIGIEKLATKLEEAFDKLKVIIDKATLDPSPEFVNSKSLSESEITQILTNSKTETEKLVNKTNDIVDEIQSTLTKKYQDYSKFPAKLYNLDCTNDSYMFYYKAKSLKNGSPTDLKNCTSHSLPFEKDPFLDNILTNRETSTAHVPTNVFDSSREIQSVANWTESVDKTFLKVKDDSQVKWQFFCSYTGLFKIYPGIRWNIQLDDWDKDNSMVDFFDCRSEQWYLEATAYPKKMIIMVDKSGSMKGRRRIIANHTVYEILNTLTENDFFNILLFTKDIIFANKTKILMQATDKNKKNTLEHLADVFHPDGIAEYDIGLKASFSVLRNDKVNESETEFYNYLLMIITDGSPLAYQDLIDEQNKDVGARIFTYLIGQGTTERDMVTSMACKNQGFAVEIATLADVKENVQKYLNVIARKNALMRNAFNVWTGIHQMQLQPNEEGIPTNVSSNVYATTVSYNSFPVTFAPNITGTSSPDMTTGIPSNVTTPQPSQLTKIDIYEDKPIQLFVTASKAAFDETNETAQLNNGVLLGAAGVDVPISEFVKTAPFWKIGVNAYLFGITSNGFVLFHPRYTPQYKKHIKYFFRNVDISELEIDINSEFNTTYTRNDQIVETSNKFQLRKEMLDQDPKLGVKTAGKILSYQIVDDFKTAFQISRTYYITGIEKTSYKFGLAVPDDQKVPLFTREDFKAISKEKFQTELKLNFEELKNKCDIIYTERNGSGITMKNYEFCYMNHFLASLQMKNPICTLIEVMTSDTILKSCVTNVIDGSIYVHNIFKEMQYSSGFPKAWESFNEQNNSIQQIFSMHHFGLIRYHNYENLSYENFIANHSRGIDDPLYQETVLVSQLLNNNKILVARPLPNEVVKKNLAKSSLIFTVTKPIVHSGHYIGIIGVQAKYESFQSVLMDNTICSDNKYECFVITQSGLILLNNQNFQNNGEMLTEIDCALMEDLVAKNIFTEQSVYDFQALCSKQPKPADSFSMKFINPFTQFFRFTLWLFYEVFIILQNFSITSFIWSLSAQDDNGDGMPSQFADNSIGLSFLSTETPVHKAASNIYTSDSQSNAQMENKSKRQHELDVKNMLKSEIQRCSNSYLGSDTEWSGCIQKAVSTICRQDKVHVAPPSDQHVEKLTPQNKISHCETACTILRSEYSKVWQEQDECKLPQKLCHKFMPTYTSITSPIMQSPQVPKENHVEQFNAYRSLIVEPNDVNEPSPNQEIKNGSICGRFCPAKKWFVQAIRNTNLLLVILEKPNSACSCDCNNGFGKPKELKRNLDSAIENPYIKKPVYFRDFVNFTKTENSTSCTDEAQRSCMPIRLLLALSVFLSVFIVY